MAARYSRVQDKPMGGERLSANKKAKPDRPDAANDAPISEDTKRKKRGSTPNDVGKALRTVYDETLQESVPNDFLDLLGKLS
ncbi:hypothetical protein HMF7854_13875 [Sphingomonas ginkgonis]|uniref:Anti-sigma factor NepR domain-containing protein n=1 Tax=Sphingomonas ginkgonis TaxID=2315330 RepID=A0A3R9WU10_9SPHN|nr:NepR family anti-sigma factor [Sphingomonas ginkgonis]RST31802.1 hypothetical protein HMF7854_13875 [Sphingomonas ginkgonis]